MTRLAGLVACIFAAFIVFFLASSTPPALRVNASPAVFSAGRALTDIAIIAAAPHPNGSGQIAQVRAYLLDRMRGMGLAPRAQTAKSLNMLVRPGAAYVGGGEVTNLIGVLPGRDRSLPALAIMAHYDTVPGSPGAADDSTGVGVALEAVRALAARGQPQRDVDLILTDGEERGLLGARAFFGADPLAKRIGFVINLEARGGGGRAAMFQTGQANGADIALFAETTRRPDSTSLLPFIYHLLPNNTDFSISLEKGLPGYNLAFIGRQFDYHSPSSTLAALDKGSVQHMGDEILGPAAALAFSRNLPPRAPDLVYGDLLGLVIVHYPPVWGWLVLALSAGLILTTAVLARRLAPLDAASIVTGALAGLVLLVVDGLILYLARHATGVASGWFAYRPLLARFPLFETAMVFCALAGILAVVSLAGRKGGASGAWIGFLLLGLVAAVALQVAAPLAAFLVAWPLLAASACAALTKAGRTRSRISWSVFFLIAIPALAWVGAFFHNFLQGLDTAPVCALFAWLAAMIVWPLVPSAQDGRPGSIARALVPALFCLAVGLGIVGVLRFTNPWSARYPRAVTPEIVEMGNKAWRASLPPLDGWTRAFLGAGPITDLNDIAGQPRLIATAQAGLAPPSTVVSLTPAPGGGETLTAQFDRAARDLALDVKADTPVTASIEGLPATSAFRPGLWTHVVWRAQPGGTFTLTLQGAHPGSVDIRYALSQASWPAGAGPIPPLPADHMAWGDHPPITVLAGDLTGRLGPPRAKRQRQ